MSSTKNYREEKFFNSKIKKKIKGKKKEKIRSGCDVTQGRKHAFRF